MPYDLRLAPWLPWRRRSGAVEWSRPAQITDGAESADPIVALACPRPDFNAAVTEFLIGLFSVALAPKDERAWRALWDAPPAPAEIDAALRALPDAFFLDGDGPRAFQDLDPLDDCEPRRVEQMLIDAPGDKTVRDNIDFFIKRHAALALSRAAAAMALITLQTYAPSGGQGHRTSMRGGGPLTTLAEPRANSSEEPLWRLVWANAETAEQIYQRDGDAGREWTAQDRYPWLTQTRTSNSDDTGVVTTPVDADPAQAYFGMPRRIRLDFEDRPATCALTGRDEERPVARYRTRNFGTNYTAWRHPLSPYYQSNAAWLPLHPQPGGVGWRDWLGLLVRRAGDTREPAAAIAHFAERRAPTIGLRQFRIVAFGYDMDNMKARGWAQAVLPAYSADLVERQAPLAERCVAGADHAARLLVGAVKQGLFENPKEAPGDFSHIRSSLWDATQGDFFTLMHALADDPDAFDGSRSAAEFARTLRTSALAIFDVHCPLDGFEHGAMQRPIAARHLLDMALRGYGKAGATFYAALSLAPRQSTNSRKSKERA